MLAIFTHSIHFIYTKKLRQIRILLIEKKNGWDGGCGGGGTNAITSTTKQIQRYDIYVDVCVSMIILLFNHQWVNIRWMEPDISLF